MAVLLTGSETISGSSIFRNTQLLAGGGTGVAILALLLTVNMLQLCHSGPNAGHQEHFYQTPMQLSTQLQV